MAHLTKTDQISSYALIPRGGTFATSASKFTYSINLHQYLTTFDYLSSLQLNNTPRSCKQVNNTGIDDKNRVGPGIKSR
jgi:hypothetical protein